MDNSFWNQFWPQFWGGVASAIFVGVLSLVCAYVARLRIARFFRRMHLSLRHTLLMEERAVEDVFDKSLKQK